MTATRQDPDTAGAPGPVPIITVANVTKAFPSPEGELTVLDGIDFELYPGEIVALLGKSG